MRQITLIIMIAGLAGSAITAQLNSPVALPPGSVDGSLHPELIPDTVAFRLFFTAVSEDKNTEPKVAAAKREAKLRPIGLVDADRLVFSDTLSNFREELDRADKSSVPISYDQVASSTLETLRLRLSKDGFQRLQRFIQAQKAFMRRVPYPPMAAWGFRRS